MGKIWSELKSLIYTQVFQECIGEMRNIYDKMFFSTLSRDGKLLCGLFFYFNFSFLLKIKVQFLVIIVS